MKLLSLDWNSTEICTPSIGLNNSLLPNKLQGLIKTNGWPKLLVHMYASLGLELLYQVDRMTNVSYVWKVPDSGPHMMTSSNGNILRVTGQWWIPLTKASDAELWCFLWPVPEQTVEQTIEMPAIWDAIMLIMMSLEWYATVWWSLANKTAKPVSEEDFGKVFSKSYIDRLVQERRNSIANALELHLSYTNPSIWSILKNAKS